MSLIMKRQKVRMRAARTATKVQEKELISKAKRLMKNPDLILPVCGPDCKHPGFEKIRKQIQRIQQFKDDEKKLNKFAKGGDPLAKAYAATLLIAHAEKAPIFAVAQLPVGEVTYAIRGKTRKEKLIGVQHFDNPDLRLTGIEDIAKKKGLHVFSTKKKMVCTGKENKPPIEFIDEQVNLLKVQKKDEGIYGCRHLTLENIRENEYFGKPFIKIDWISANTTFAMCESCSKGNSYGQIIKRIASKNIEKDFKINVSWHPICKVDCDSCKIDNIFGMDSDIIKEYLKREIIDKELIEKYRKNITEKIKTGEKVYISDINCYCLNSDEYIKSLNPNKDEEIALKAIIEKYDNPILIDKPTPSKVLALLWEYGEDAIFAITNDKELAKKIYKKSKSENPSQILLEAKNEAKKKGILSTLPKYKKLPSVANFANKIAKSYKTLGKKEAIKLIEKEESKDTKVKSVSYAFLLNFDSWKGKEWQYTDVEREYAEYLKEYTQKLSDSKPEDYHDALQELLKSSGSTEIIQPK